jgi:hypothetical protein
LAYKIRLNAPGNWLPAEDDNEPWHQVDFAITMWLHSITTKGSSKSDQWVTHYRISYAESDGILKNFTDSGVVKVKLILKNTFIIIEILKDLRETGSEKSCSLIAIILPYCSY